jgi:hypothetical protein
LFGILAKTGNSLLQKTEADVFREKVDLIACWVSIQLE